MTAKPQANTLDEIEPILRFMLEKLVFDNSIAGKVPIAEAKQQILALITEARIDELDLFLRQDILTNGKYSIIERKKELRNEKA